MDRFWSKVDKSGLVPDARPDLGPCWLWTASRSGGYGRFSIGDGKVQAHRFAYELLVGEIPDGLDLDHLCRVRHCVNPTHLEPVTRRVNTLRGLTIPAAHVAKTHCPQGHEYSEANLYREGNRRRCRVCHNARCVARQRRRRADAHQH